MDGSKHELLAEASRAGFEVVSSDIARRLDDAIDAATTPLDRAELLIGRTVLNQAAPECGPKIADARRAHDEFLEAGRPDGAALAAAMSAAFHHRDGDLAAAVDDAVEAMTLLDGHDIGKYSPRAANSLVVLYTQMGALELATVYARMAWESSTDGGGLEVVGGTVSRTLAEALRAGLTIDLDLARSVVDVLRTEVSDSESGRIVAAVAAIDLALATDDLATLSELDIDETIPERLPVRFAAFSHLAIGSAFARLGDDQRAHRQLDRAVETLQAIGDPQRLARALSERSSIRERAGDLLGALADARTEADVRRVAFRSHIGGLADQIAERSRLEVARRRLMDQASKLAEVARTDALTGLGTRGWLESVLDDLSDAPGEICAVMIDIDEFKSVNDRFGHAHGDQVLRRLGEIMLRATASHHLPARYGGEEFAVLLPDGDLAAGRQLAERLRTACRAEDWSDVDPEIGRITLSAGVAVGPCTSIRTVLRQADERLYCAKRAGRDRVVTN